MTAQERLAPIPKRHRRWSRNSSTPLAWRTQRGVPARSGVFERRYPKISFPTISTVGAVLKRHPPPRRSDRAESALVDRLQRSVPAR